MRHRYKPEIRVVEQHLLRYINRYKTAAAPPRSSPPRPSHRRAARVRRGGAPRGGPRGGPGWALLPGLLAPGEVAALRQELAAACGDRPEDRKLVLPEQKTFHEVQEAVKNMLTDDFSNAARNATSRVLSRFEFTLRDDIDVKLVDGEWVSA